MNDVFSNLDYAVLKMLKDKTKDYWEKHTGQHINRTVPDLLQQIVDDVLCQKHQTMTPSLFRLITTWITNWLMFHCQNLHMSNNRQIGDYGDNNDVTFDHFTTMSWILFLVPFTTSRVQFEMSNGSISIIPDPHISTGIGSQSNNYSGTKLFNIPLSFISPTGLVGLFIIQGLHSTVFDTNLSHRQTSSLAISLQKHRHNTKSNRGTGTKINCRFDDKIKFDGAFIVRHMMILMVSGIRYYDYNDCMRILDMVKSILSNLPPINEQLARTHPIRANTTIESIPLPPTFARPGEPEYLNNEYRTRLSWENDVNPTESTYFQLYRCYLDIVKYDDSIKRNPADLVNIVAYYCSCKLKTPDFPCCSICHHKCDKWRTETHNSLAHVINNGEFHPNVLIPRNLESHDYDIGLSCV